MQSIALEQLPYYLIQAIRLSHALMESKYRVYVPPEHAPKYQVLKRIFEIDFTTREAGVTLISNYELNHEEPRTAIGNIARPLIFPHAIADRCKSLWSKNREIAVSFAGLVTGSRAAIIGDWCQENLRDVLQPLPNLNPFPHRLANKMRTLLGEAPKSYSAKLDKLLLGSSFRGRTFPIKAWDEEYYTMMANSQFILCPDGDHRWSYRFYEAVLCGAMPIVERRCPGYDGYSIYTFKDKFEALHWNECAVRRNFDLCLKQLTIPTDELNQELDALLA